MTNENSHLTLTDDNFEQEVLQGDGPVIVDFWAPWCGPCRVLGPVVEELARDFEGQAKVGKLNVDESPRTAQRFGVRSIPTVLFFQNGELVDSVIGVVPKATLAGKLTALSAVA